MDAPSSSTMKKWQRNSQRGVRDLQDEQRSGRLKTNKQINKPTANDRVNIERDLDIIMGDRRAIVILLDPSMAQTCETNP